MKKKSTTHFYGVQFYKVLCFDNFGTNLRLSILVAFFEEDIYMDNIIDDCKSVPMYSILVTKKHKIFKKTEILRVSSLHWLITS